MANRNSRGQFCRADGTTTPRRIQRQPWTIPVKATALEIMQAMDEWAAARNAEDSTTSNTESIKLWFILTALRGPDLTKNCFALKRDGTAVIRALFPNLSSCAYINNKTRTVTLYWHKVTEHGPIYGEHTHFNSHLESAAAALGLKTENKVLPAE